ncbi:MAG: hypothetical protein Ct9H300mP11_29140 [Chloroflexota bacterium]|nr:MAG: hypothetical protein Ct9H300mP11_29140 [Chloroflexota bacterium]
MDNEGIDIGVMFPREAFLALEWRHRTRFGYGHIARYNDWLSKFCPGFGRERLERNDSPHD